MALTAEQIRARRETVGASDVPIILGLSKYKTPKELYDFKHSTEEPEPSEDSEASLWGSKLEKLIVEAVGAAYKQGAGIWNAGPRIHSDATWATCTPDGCTPEFFIEVKNRRFEHGWGPSGSQEIPADVEAQVRWSMFVTGEPKWGVGVLIGGNNFRHYLIERDEEWERWVFPIVEAWREGVFVEDAQWKPATSTGIKREATPGEVALMEAFKDSQWCLDEAKQRHEAIRESLIEDIGDDAGLTSSTHTATLIPVKGRETTDWEAVASKLHAALIPRIGRIGHREQADALLALAVKESTKTGKPYRRLTVKEHFPFGRTHGTEKEEAE